MHSRFTWVIQDPEGFQEQLSLGQDQTKQNRSRMNSSRLGCSLLTVSCAKSPIVWKSSVLLWIYDTAESVRSGAELPVSTDLVEEISYLFRVLAVWQAACGCKARQLCAGQTASLYCNSCRTVLATYLLLCVSMCIFLTCLPVRNPESQNLSEWASDKSSSQCCLLALWHVHKSSSCWVTGGQKLERPGRQMSFKPQVMKS